VEPGALHYWSETMGYWSEYDEEGSMECKFCGEGGLEWGLNDDGEWRLFDEHGEVHRCDAIDDAAGAFEGIE
jgi:transcription initiation factor TFIIIB Brf1 subunit/transcription initiation factor TFIIB